MAIRKTRRPANTPAAASALTFTVANLGAEAQLVRSRARAAVVAAEHRLEGLRHQAAQSALDWVLAHEGRVEQFRRWSQGTRAGRALETVLAELRAVAGAKSRPAIPRKPKPAGKAVVKKAAAKKTVAHKPTSAADRGSRVRRVR